MLANVLLADTRLPPSRHRHLRSGRRGRLPVGLGRVPDRSSATDQEIAAMRQLLAEGREEEALRLHRDLTGQGTDETQKVLESLRAGL